MFRRTEQDTDEAPARDEHAYEDNWYRSLKALAEHRAAEEETDPEAPGAEASDENGRGPGAEDPGSEAENPADVGLATDGALAVASEDALDGPDAMLAEAGLQPVDGVPTAAEPEVRAQGPDTAWPAAETSQPGEPDTAWPAAETSQPGEPDTAWPAAETSQPGEPDTETSQPGEPDTAWPAAETSEVEELTVRTDHIIERLRTLRDADGLEPSPADDARRVESADAPLGHEELGTRAQQLLERLRTLRTLNDAEGRGSEPENPQAWG